MIIKVDKKKNPDQYSAKYLQELVADKNACVEKRNVEHHLALHPFHLNDLNGSVNELVGKKLFKYSHKHDGLLIGYKNMKLLQNFGDISDDSCYIHITLNADFYIFKPLVGQSLEAVVNKKSADHVGCLAHQMFNVSLPQPEDDENWIGHSIRLNSVILLTVTKTDFEGKLPYISGEILSVLSTPEDYEEEPLKSKKSKHDEIAFDDSSVIKKHKKRKHSDSQVEEEDVAFELDTSATVSVDKEKKSKKHRKK